MVTMFLVGLGVMVFIDFVRWINSDAWNKPHLVDWILQSIIGNAIWILILTIVAKLVLWVFS